MQFQPAFEQMRAIVEADDCLLQSYKGLCRDKAKIRTFVLQDIELKGNLLSS
ncbi:hypothetical protein [Pseudomonas sp. C5pp]|uniref:hypothetical protein n=1 Tax=Pseudomonas sp. C5pp TaxID=1586081 RepID=UPI0013791479|nr:hypothetical protein [Pseudomonas sp. C5pp]